MIGANYLAFELQPRLITTSRWLVWRKRCLISKIKGEEFYVRLARC